MAKIILVFDDLAEFNSLSIWSFNIEELDTMLPKVEMLNFIFFHLKAGCLGALKAASASEVFKEIWLIAPVWRTAPSPVQISRVR